MRLKDICDSCGVKPDGGDNPSYEQATRAIKSEILRLVRLHPRSKESDNPEVKEWKDRVLFLKSKLGLIYDEFAEIPWQPNVTDTYPPQVDPVHSGPLGSIENLGPKLPENDPKPDSTSSPTAPSNFGPSADQIKPNADQIEPNADQSGPTADQTEPRSDQPVENKAEANTPEPQLPHPILNEAALDLRQLGRPSLYNRLDDTRRDAIYELRRHYPERIVVELIKLPPPLGLGIETSKSGIHRFTEDYEKHLTQRNRSEPLKLVTAALQNQTDPTAFQKLASSELKKRLYLATHDETTDPKTLDRLVTCLLKLQKL